MLHKPHEVPTYNLPLYNFWEACYQWEGIMDFQKLACVKMVLTPQPNYSAPHSLSYNIPKGST